jgi:hypothetical protein
MRFLCLSFLILATCSFAAEPFGVPGGAEVQRVDEVFDVLLQEDYDLEILVSFGTSSGGSAGHLALSIREGQEETVYSANFYADRAKEHADHYTEKLVPAIPKKEYIYSQSPTVSSKAVFGLDYGEIFKRSLIGIRMKGLSSAQIKGIKDFYQRLNRDYSNRVVSPEYHRGEVVYNYMKLNCAKTVAQALKYGAGFESIEVKGNHIFSSIPGSKFLFSHVPTATTLNILEVLSKAGVGFSVVLYKKYVDSDYLDTEHNLKFSQLPNRFPSVKSLDFFNGSTKFESYENLKAMYLLYHMGKFSLIIDGPTRELRIEKSAQPKPYRQALELADREGYKKSKHLIRRIFRSMGIKITSDTNTSDLYESRQGAPLDLFPLSPGESDNDPQSAIDSKKSQLFDQLYRQ